MGLAGSSCCQHPQKHPDVTESLQNPPDDDDEQGVLVMEGDVEADRKRGDARKGNKARIGGAVGDDDEGDEEHLLNHKKTKEMDKGTKELIKAAMKQDRVCAILEDAEVDAILTTMEYFQFSKGSVIVEQGKMGTTFFVTHSGTLEVSVNGNVVNTLMEGQAFGGLALLYNCPRTATVKALIDAGVWGANGHNFKQVLAQNAANRQADNLKFLDSIKIFDGLNQKQKDQIALAAFSESFDAGQRVATQGEALAAIYFVKKGGLAVMAGGEVKADGKFSGGKEEHHLSSGEYIGAALLSAKTRPLWENTLLADGRADGKSAKTELLCISVKDLKEILGNNLAKMLETALVNKGLRMCPVMSQFSSTQRNDIAKAIVIKDLAAGGTVEEGVRYIVVLEGTVTGMYKEEEAEVEQKRWPLLQRLLSAVDAVEDAAGASGWSEKELAWSLALVQKLSNAALWCLLTHRSTRAADSVDNDHAPKDPLAVRCKVLKRLELALRHSEAFGFDHLQNLHLLWSALEEVRVSVLARAAIQLKPQVLEPMSGPVSGRVPAPWSRVGGQEFFQQVRGLGLRNFLQQEGGLVQVKDFLPSDLAQEMLEMLKALGQEEWYLSENQSSVDAEHRFWRYEGEKLDKVKSIMQELDPKLHPRLQGAKYESGGKITLHNDALRWVVRPDECSDQYPAGTTVYRKVALIYYLTQEINHVARLCLP